MLKYIELTIGNVLFRLNEILNFLDAVKMIRDYFKAPGNFSERQRFHFLNFSSETFLEATPTVFIQIIIMITILGKRIGIGEMEINEFLGNNKDLAIISFTSSLLSSSFGISRYI